MIRLFHWGTALLFLVSANKAFAVMTPPSRGVSNPAQDVSTPLGRDQLGTALNNTEKTRVALIKLPDSGFSNIGDLVSASKSASEILPTGFLGPTSGSAGIDRGLAATGGGRSVAFGGGSGDQPKTMERSDGSSFPDVSTPGITSAPPSGNAGGGGSGNSTTERLIGAGDAPPQSFNASTDGVFGSVGDFSSLSSAFNANLGDNFGKYGDFSSFLPAPNTDTGTFEAASKFSSDSAAVAKGSNAPAFTIPDMTKTMAATASKPKNDGVIDGNGTSNTLVANVFPTGVTPGTTPAAGTTGTPADEKSKVIADKIAEIDPPKAPDKEPPKVASANPANGDKSKTGGSSDTTSMDGKAPITTKNNIASKVNTTPADPECAAVCKEISTSGLGCSLDEYNSFKRFSVSYDGDLGGDVSLNKFQKLKDACGTKSPGFKVKEGGSGIEILYNESKMSKDEKKVEGGYESCLRFITTASCLPSAPEPQSQPKSGTNHSANSNSNSSSSSSSSASVQGTSGS